MSKLVDKERLAKLAASLDSRMKTAVNTEKERAMAAEQAVDAKANANAAAIVDMKKEEKGGILFDAKAYADAQDASLKSDLEGQIGDEKDRAEGQEAAIRQEFASADATLKSELQAEIDRDVAAEASRVDAKIKTDIQVETDRAKGIEAGLDGRIAANEAFVAAQPAIDKVQDDRLSALEALFEGDDSVDSKIDAVDDKVDALEKRVKDNEDDLAVVMGEGAGSIKKAEADAKAYADQQITALVDSAPEAMNTLNELAEAIKGNKSVYDAYVAEHATAMTQMKTDLQKEIDDDVKVVADELAKQKDAEQEDTLANQIKANDNAIKAEKQAREKAITDEVARVDKKISDDIATESAKRVAEEQKLNKAITDEANRADEEEKAIRKDFGDADKKIVDDQKLVDQAQNNRLADLEAAVGNGEGSLGAAIQAVQNNLNEHVTAANNKNNTQDQAIAAAKKAGDDAQAAADKAQEEVDAVEGRMATAEGEIDALQAFMNGHSHSKIETDIKANADAIEAEVKKGGNRDQAIDKALEAYSTTEEMKGVIGNVVNSLALTMENDQVVLKLGGVDGIALTSVHLDMATDDDIDAIIAGLDA